MFSPTDYDIDVREWSFAEDSGSALPDRR